MSQHVLEPAAREIADAVRGTDFTKAKFATETAVEVGVR
jgi:hypothetical protein